jgi:hypothetical protein
MGKLKLFAQAIAIWFFASSVLPVSAQKLEATVLYRQNSDSVYLALVPGYSDPASPDCAADLGNAACYEHSATTGPYSYNVVGTTLSLLLPDRRIAVINCVNKYSPKGTYILRRTCGMPLVEHVQAEFKGNLAKLAWSAGSPDNAKSESEKYRVIAVLDQR